ncbi:MAG: hypothetical protein P8P32_10995 [Akkermansiaceae bacterium]|nr:hypothetical protein [Akkermansiaceae bacterium]MDG2322260.1 hypothetical protein [Akkermansiaceae bacterium]
MSAILIPLTKGFLGLMGVSSFMFLSVRRDVELQVQKMDLRAGEFELEAAELEHEQRELELKVVPEKK